MKKQRLSNVLTGLIIAVLGVLVAFFGAATILDFYLGVVACVTGACLLAYGFMLMSKKIVVPPFAFIGGAALIAIAVGLFVRQIDVSVIIAVLVYAVLGGGAGLICYGVYLISKKASSLGITDMIIGAVAVTFAVLFLVVNGFETVFWIITGIVIAAYGVFITARALSKK